MAKHVLKASLRGICWLAVFPSATASAFGRWKALYTMCAHAYALAPGIFGDYLRIAFYRLTLSECSQSSRVSFGSFFAHPEAKLGPQAYIGSFCIIGKAVIGGHTQIASGVQILSGGQQHSRDEAGKISGVGGGVLTTVRIGAQCWIGAGAIVMADVGSGTTIGAGSVVTHPIPAGCVAVGNPARVIRTAAAQG